MGDSNKKINLDKGGKKINLEKNVNQAEEASKQALANEITELDENGNPINQVNPPQPEEPASVQQPDLSKEAIEEAIENGPQEPAKKGFAWLWAIIGIAIVLAFLGWVFLKKGESEPEQTPDETEETAPVIGDSTNTDSVTNLPSETENEATPSAENATATASDENGVSTQPSDGSMNVDNTSKVTSDQNMVSGSTPASTSKASPAPNDASVPTGDVQTEALKVIHGDYGDGHIRKERLGASYKEIQKRVNELKRSGKF